MSPKQSISKDIILEAARDLVREKGAAKLNARTLAARLGTSTMPIYSVVGSMSDLDSLLRLKVSAELNEWQKRSWSKNTMLDMAVGYVMFAREEANLFRFLFGGVLRAEEKNADESQGMPADFSQILEFPGADSMLQSNPGYATFIAGMARDRQNSFVFRTWVFVHGLANLVSEGLINLDRDELIAHLEAAGGAFYAQSGGGR